MHIEEGHLADKSEGRAGSSNDSDFPCQPSIGPVGRELHMNQRSWPEVAQGGRPGSVNDPGVVAHAEVNGRRIDLVAKNKCLAFGIDVDDLSIGICGRGRNTQPYVARKHFMMRPIEHRIYGNPFAFFNGKLRGFSAVAEDMSALVKADLPSSTAEDGDRHMVADVIYAADYSANQGGLAIGNGWRIDNGVVPIGRQHSTGGCGAVEDHGLRALLFLGSGRSLALHGSGRLWRDRVSGI